MTLCFYAIVCDISNSWLKRYCIAFDDMYTIKMVQIKSNEKSDINNDELLWLLVSGSEHCRKM